MARHRLLVSVLLVLFCLSGAAGLGYQMVWARQFAAGLGHEMPAVLAVVGAFLGGMALGAWTLDGAVSRSARPGVWYAALEIVIGLWAALTTALVPAVNDAALRLIGLEPSPLRHWAVAFALPLLALLPATAALGATLPAMERFVAPLVADGRCLGAVYAANTLGAVAGTLASAFWLVPAFGLTSATGLLAAVNLGCGGAALFLGSRAASPATVSPANGSSADSPSSRPVASRTRLAATVFLTGLLGIGYEVAGVRVLSQVLENTVYTFAAVLAVYLLGTALGAALYQHFGRRGEPKLLLTDLLGVLAFTGLLGVLVLARAPTIYDACRATLGDSRPGVLAAEMAVAAAVFALPTLFMGAAFSHLVQAARRREGGVGRAAALNTFGGALAGALCGVWLLPLLGSKWTLTLIALGYLALLPKIVGVRRGWLAASVALVFVLPAGLQIAQVPPGGRLVEYREGVLASVAVVADATGHRTLRVNNRFQMGGTAAAAAEYRHAHLPLLLHPAPTRALVLGLGTGITLGGAGAHPGLHSAGVELVPEVVEVMPAFEPYNFSPARHPQLKVFVADARRFVRAADARYDVIIADLFHPARDGAGSLYTREHFAAIRERLAPGGLFCQWLPLHQLDGELLPVIARTFLDVFPEAQGWLLHFNVDIPVLGLIGSLEPRRYSRQWVEGRLSDARLEAELKKLALADSVRLFGHLLAGPKELRAFAGSGPLNTDDRPRVTFDAPRFVYRKNATAYGRLLTLLKRHPPDARDALRLDTGAEEARFAQQLAAYWQARDVYLRGLMDEAEGRQAEAIAAYIESARLSEDFTSGYAQCLTIASLQAQSNPAAARALLQRLVEARPSRPVAKEMLQRLFGE
jgi:spermidine synthase